MALPSISPDIVDYARGAGLRRERNASEVMPGVTEALAAAQGRFHAGMDCPYVVASHWLCDPDLPAHAVSEVPDSIAGHPGRMARDGPSRPQVAAPGLSAGAYIGGCGNSAERRWNERIFGLRITPSRISIARRMVWSRSQASGPSITVRRCGISASLISQVAEFHR